MTCLLSTCSKLGNYLLVLPLILLIGCVSSPNQNPKTLTNTQLTQSTEKLTTLFKQLSQVTNHLQTITPISQCRFEITTHWSTTHSNSAQGFYRATHSQRFSFKHDLRAIDHSPNYTANIDGEEQQWQEKLQLSYNRLLPYQFSYYDDQTFEYKQHNGSDDQFSLIGFSKAPLTLMKAIEATLTEIASLCGNDLNQLNFIEHKILGHWNITTQATSVGELLVYPHQAILERPQGTIRGNYTINREGDHFRLTINPEGEQAKSIALDFITSNYAKILMLDDVNQNFTFDPDKLENDSSLTQLNLFRIGDLW